MKDDANGAVGQVMVAPGTVSAVPRQETALGTVCAVPRQETAAKAADGSNPNGGGGSGAESQPEREEGRTAAAAGAAAVVPYPRQPSITATPQVAPVAASADWGAGVQGGPDAPQVRIIHAFDVPAVRGRPGMSHGAVGLLQPRQGNGWVLHVRCRTATGPRWSEHGCHHRRALNADKSARVGSV